MTQNNTINNKIDRKINDSDLKNVADWLGVNTQDIKIELVKESMLNYESDAKSMLESYDEFPKDKKRTEKIMNLLKLGKNTLPIYVELGDQNNFVMEGRHRMVAFYLLGLKEITVARVSKKHKM